MQNEFKLEKQHIKACTAMMLAQQQQEETNKATGTRTFNIEPLRTYAVKAKLGEKLKQHFKNKKHNVH